MNDEASLCKKLVTVVTVTVTVTAGGGATTLYNDYIFTTMTDRKFKFKIVD